MAWCSGGLDGGFISLNLSLHSSRLKDVPVTPDSDLAKAVFCLWLEHQVVFPNTPSAISTSWPGAFYVDQADIMVAQLPPPPKY